MDDNLKTKSHGLIKLNHSLFAESPEPYIQKLTNQWLGIVATTDTSDFSRINNLKESLSQLGQSEQQALWKLNNSLKHPLEKLMRDAEGGGVVTQLLRDLQVLILKIKPPKQSIWNSLFNMFKLLFSVKESIWHIWIEAYPANKKQIMNVTESLEKQKRQLTRDNSVWLSDKNTLHQHMLKLESSFDMMTCFEKNISHEMSYNQDISSGTNQIVVDELLPVLQQRLIELQQQLLIARQSFMTMDLFIRQNDSQIKGIDQAIYTTTSAIEVTASIYMLKQSAQSNIKLGSTINHNKNVVLNVGKLKNARQLIDKALKQMEEVKIASIPTQIQIDNNEN
jgi:uncharacterized protein YaaN involved in tellurite resistance